MSDRAAGRITTSPAMIHLSVAPTEGPAQPCLNLPGQDSNHAAGDAEAHASAHFVSVAVSVSAPLVTGAAAGCGAAIVASRFSLPASAEPSQGIWKRPH